MTEYDAILFDNDGVLVEPPSDEALLAAAEEAFRAVGVEAPDEKHVADVVRGVTPDLLEEVCAVYGVDRREFWEARDTPPPRRRSPSSSPEIAVPTTT